MQSILRTLTILGTVEGAVIARAGQILCTTVDEEKNRTLADCAGALVELHEAAVAAGRAPGPIVLDVEGACLVSTSVTETIVLMVITSSEPSGPLLRAAMRSAVDQLRESEALPAGGAEVVLADDDEDFDDDDAAADEHDGIDEAADDEGPEQDEAAPQAPPEAPATAAEPAVPARGPEPEAEEAPGDIDAEPLLPAVLELLAERLGPVARVTFKHGVATWKDSGASTVERLPALADLLAEDLLGDEDKRSFRSAVQALVKG